MKLFSRTFLAWACGLLQHQLHPVEASTELTAGTSTGKPTVRIAYLYSDTEYFTPARFMMKHFGIPNRTILPDYDVVVDGYPFQEYDGDVAVKVTEIFSGDTPAYHAIVGPWGRVDSSSSVRLTAQNRVLQVIKGDNVEFTVDRARYPYVFRTIRSIFGILRCWFYIASVNDWPAVVSAFKETETVDASLLVAADYNIRNFAILASSTNPELWARAAWMNSAIQNMRENRTRVIMTYIDTDEMYELVCRIHRLQVSGLQYFTQGSYVPGWYLGNFSHAYGDCNSDEIYDAVRGYISTVHTPIAPGLNLFGVLQMPAPDGDQSKIPLTCMPDINTDLYYHSGEHFVLGLIEGAIINPAIDGGASAQRYLANSGSETDMICAALLALHDAFYNKGITLKDVEERDENAFEALVDSMGHVDFNGPAGFVRYYPNSGDPEVIYYIITQGALPWARNDSAEVTALVTYPNGPRSDPLIRLNDDNIPLTWRDGSTGLGPKSEAGVFPPCSERNAELVWDSCVPCAPGTAYDPLLDACRRCSPGEYQPENGTSECILATPGYYINDTSNPVESTPCPAGHECPAVGTVTPRMCPRGRFAESAGSDECLLCPRGTYQNEIASTACSPCEAILAGSTTADIASTAASQCICPEGAFLRSTSADQHFQDIGGGSSLGACEACPEGMSCKEGSDMNNWDPATLSAVGPIPLVSYGYMTLAQAPLTVYLCKTESQCPGGLPGMCAPYRDATTVACGDCLQDAFESGDECEDCGPSKSWPMAVAIVGGIVCVACATIAINRDVHKTPAASLLIVAVSSLLFTSLQALGVFSQMSVPWVEPVKTILRMSQLLSFDLRLLKVACVMGNKPVRSFAVRQSVAVLAIPFIACTLAIKKYVPRFGKPNTRIFVELSNSIGTLYSVFFISIMISALNPFICYKHPGDSGESVQFAPSLLCFDSDEHSSMIVIGAIAICAVPLPFLALCTFGIVQYPKYINSHNSSNFLHALRFLFFRYVPKRYYFQIFMLVRSMLLCLIPAILRGQAATQVLFMCLVLCVYVLLEEEQQPWRSTICNPLDATMAMMLLIMLICGALFLDDTPQKDAVAVLSSMIIIGLLVVGLGGLTYALWRRFVPKAYYDFFICHHKAHAAAQARFLKMLLQLKRTRVQVFIDSDDLRELDGLFDIVKSRVKHLVVFLTSDTMKRPWCAGEIVTALRARLVVTRLETPSFVLPLEEHLEDPSTYLDTEGCNLSEYGIQWDDVSCAFRDFLKLESSLQLSQQARGTRRFDLAAAALLKQRASTEKVKQLRDERLGGILVSTLGDSDEANAAGGILVSIIAQDVFRICEEGLCMLADAEQSALETQKYVRHAAAVVIVLSSGCLQSLQFMSVICELMMAQESAGHSPAGITVNTPSFEFPSSTLIESLGTETLLPELEGVCGSSAACAELVRSFFKRISILFPTHAAKFALDTQAEEVLQRIRGHVTKSGILSSFAGPGSADMIHSPTNGTTFSKASRMKVGSTSENFKSRTETSGQQSSNVPSEVQSVDSTPVPPSGRADEPAPSLSMQLAQQLRTEGGGTDSVDITWAEEL